MWKITPVLLESRVASKQTQALLSKNKLAVWINPWKIQQFVNCATKSLKKIQRWKIVR